MTSRIERFSTKDTATAQPIPAPSHPALTRRLVLVLAIACGLMVANLYYAQPLLDDIARTFGVGSGAAGLVVTLTQLGYAAGLLFLVPLGDRVDRRRLVFTVLGGSVAALLAATVAPSIGALAAAGIVIGLTSVGAQVLVPFAATLAGDAERGRVVGQVMSGLLLGILLARVASGLLGQAVGWRAVYAIAAALMVALGVVLWRELPRLPIAADAARGGYGDLLRSVGTLIREEPILRRRMATARSASRRSASSGPASPSSWPARRMGTGRRRSGRSGCSARRARSAPRSRGGSPIAG